MMPSVLHVGPHPDDEVLGAGGTLSLLNAAGWQVHNLACSLGRPSDHDRRRRELLSAAQRIGFQTTIMDPLAQISSGDDLNQSAAAVARAVRQMIERTSPSIVMSPHPHDGHHGHEAVARGVEQALSQLRDTAPLWWMWGLWADLPAPTIFVPFGQTTMDRVLDAIAAHAGENERNHYDRLYPARAISHSILGSERVFGFGAPNVSVTPYADLLTEVQYLNGRWVLGRPRLLDENVALETTLAEDITWWIKSQSITTARYETLSNHQ